MWSAEPFTGMVVDVAVGNLLLSSKVFDSSDWTKENASVSADSTTAPDSSSTADTLIEASDSAQVHRAIQDVTKNGSAIAYTLSVSAKATGVGSRRLVLVLRRGDDGSGVYCVLDIDGAQVGVAATAFGSNWAVGTASIVSQGNGWYLCSLAGVTSDTDTTVRADIQLDHGTGTGALTNSYSGDGASGLYLWNAQLTRS